MGFMSVVRGLTSIRVKNMELYGGDHPVSPCAGHPKLNKELVTGHPAFKKKTLKRPKKKEKPNPLFRPF